MGILLGEQKGVKITTPLTNLTLALAANAVVVFTQSTFAQLVGTKSVKIKKVHLRNNAAGNTYIHIGTGVGAAFVNLIDPVYSIHNMPTTENNPLEAEAFANITAFPDAVLAGGSIDVYLELAEIG